MPRIKPILFVVAIAAAGSVVLFVTTEDSKNQILRSNTVPINDSTTLALALTQGTSINKAEPEDLKVQVASLQDQVDKLTRENTELRRFKTESVSVTNKSVTSKTEGTDENSSETEDAFSKSVKALASRAAELNQQFQKRPGQDIPELQMLNEGQWLSLAKNANLDTEDGIRAALSDVRKQAKQNFSQMIWGAVAKYSAANNGQSPTDPALLLPYFETPVDAAVLERYQLVPPGSIPSLNPLGSFILSEKAPVDREYDTHFYIGTSGYQQYSVNRTGPNSDPDTLWINR